jgi:hypothetical protein
MKVAANMVITQEEKDKAFYLEKDWDNIIYHDLFIAFAQELKKMQPLQDKAEEDFGTRYQVQGIVLSMGTFRTLMEELQDNLPREFFERVRNILNNTI